MSSPILWGPNDIASNLESGVQFSGSAGPSIQTGTVDPSSVATTGVKGSLYLNSSTGLTYRKTDAGSSTNWVLDLAASALSTDGTMAANSTTLVPSQSAVVTYVAAAGTTTNTASKFVQRDASSNAYVNNIATTYTTQAMTNNSPSYTTLTAASSKEQRFTGTGNYHSVVLPNATTLSVGFQFVIMNENAVSGGNLAIANSLSLSTIKTLYPLQQCIATCTSIATQNGTWDFNVRSNGPTAIILDEITNLDFFTSAAAGALTISARANSTAGNATATDPIKVHFINAADVVNGVARELMVTGALSITAASGSSFGLVNGVPGYIYIYMIANGSTIELALSGNGNIDESSLVSTTAISAAATSPTVLYSTSARTNVAVRKVGRILTTEATAGVHTTPTSVYWGNAAMRGGQSQTVGTAATVAGAANIIPANSRFQILPVSGSGGAQTAADITATLASAGDILILVGTSDTNTLTLASATNCVLNGSVTLALNETIMFVFYGSKFLEVSRSN